MTIARGIKTPIIKVNDNLVEIVTESIFLDMKNKGYQLNDKDIIGITESIVSIASNNYASVDDIKDDINNKFKGDNLGIVFPMLSRNRFAILLKAFARAKKDLTILLSYPYDEVGNPIMDVDTLNKLNINPYKDILLEEDYYKHFKDFKHPWTKINMVDYYKEVCKSEDANVKIVFSNNALDILNYTNNVLVSNVHDRKNTKALFKNNDNAVVYGLDDILTKSINGSGFNSKYGLLGTNLATKEKVKLFPSDNEELLKDIQKVIYNKTGKLVEIGRASCRERV